MSKVYVNFRSAWLSGALAVLLLVGIALDLAGVGLFAYEPNSPSGLAATDLVPTSDGALLRWNSVVGADSYNVYRAEELGGVYTLLGSTPSTSFFDETGCGSSPYAYTVTAVNENGESVPSNEELGSTGACDSSLACFYFPGGGKFTPIPDNVTIESKINIQTAYEIESISLKLSILHTYNSDLDVFLESPAGTIVNLFSDIGSGSDDFIGTVFSDNGANSILSGTAPYTGAFRPVSPLSAFAGESALGEWSLYVTDDATGDTGYLAGWTLDICGSAPVEDGFQSADRDSNNVISLSELLRVIQFYNSLGYHCADNPGDTEDGFIPGPGANQSCLPYDTDYNTQDWVITLSELLRIIQFYNSLGYNYCPEANTEDDYCPGL